MCNLLNLPDCPLPEFNPLPLFLRPTAHSIRELFNGCSYFSLLQSQHLPFLLQIFQVFDLCSIYILIAGSYTPFFSSVVQHKLLLAFIWLCGIGGITVEAFFPLWKWKPKFSLAMYLGMGK
jgi:channel protein (hemolysin III family)